MQAVSAQLDPEAPPLPSRALRSYGVRSQPAELTERLGREGFENWSRDKAGYQRTFNSAAVLRSAAWDNFKNNPWKTMERAAKVGQANRPGRLFFFAPLLGTNTLYP